MKSYNKDIGSYGEGLSEKYLISIGHEILFRNYRNRVGELDIISKKNEIIVFTEVKSRYTNSFGSPLESVTYFKQKQIIKTSFLFLHTNKLHNHNVRYDVIEIFFNIKNSNYSLNHIPDAFR